jgi:hypothetical protein
MISDLQLTGRACGPKHTPSLLGGVAARSLIGLIKLASNLGNNLLHII